MDKEIQQGLFTCEKHLDYFFSSRINVSFVYLSLLSLPMLLFKIFNFPFHVFIDWRFLTYVFATLAIRHNARARSVRKSCLHIENILFFSFQVPQHLRYKFPGLLFAEIFELAKDSHGGEADC